MNQQVDSILYYIRTGMPISFSDCGIGAQQAAQKIRDRFIDRSTIMGEHRDIFPEDVYKILLAAA